MTKDPQKIADVLRQGALAELGREAERRRASTAAMCRRLPTPVADHLVSATTNEAGELVLVMDSPGWAARVRYACAELALGRVIVKVQPRGGS
jgi:hypothetical protein